MPQIQKSMTRTEVAGMSDKDLLGVMLKSYDYEWQTRKAFQDEAAKRAKKGEDEDPESPENKPADGPVRGGDNKPFDKSKEENTVGAEEKPVGQPVADGKAQQPAQQPAQPAAAGQPPAQSPAATMPNKAAPVAPVSAGAPSPVPAPGAVQQGGAAQNIDAIQAEKPGALALAALHTALSETIANGEAAFAPVEQPDVVAKVAAEIDRMRDVLSTLEALHAAAYPEAPVKLGMAEPDVTAQMVKSFLAREERRQSQFANAHDQLERLAIGLESGNASRLDVAKSLRRRAGDLRRITDAAKAGEVDSIQRSQYEELVAERDALKKSYTALQDNTAKLIEMLDAKAAKPIT